jgi:hypothetical protein
MGQGKGFMNVKHNYEFPVKGNSSGCIYISLFKKVRKHGSLVAGAVSAEKATYHRSIRCGCSLRCVLWELNPITYVNSVSPSLPE